MPAVIRGRSEGESSIEELTARHVAVTIEELIERSEIIADAIEAGKLAVVGANYRLELGEVSLISNEASWKLSRERGTKWNSASNTTPWAR
jgi:Carbonic anhydrase